MLVFVNKLGRCIDKYNKIALNINEIAAKMKENHLSYIL